MLQMLCFLSVWLFSGFSYLKLKLNSGFYSKLTKRQQSKQSLLEVVELTIVFITIKVLLNSLFSWNHHTFLHFISSTTRYIIRGLNEAEAVFLSACLLQIVNLKFIFLLKSIFKRNYNLPLRIDFIKSPFCCVQCLPRIFINILSRSIFIFEWGCGSAAHVCLLKRDWGNFTNKFKTLNDFANKVMLIVANVLIKKLTSICW